MQSFRGVYNILTTPFTDDESLDIPSLRKLTEATIQTGVDGITILGVAGEAQKMSADEGRRVIETVLEVNDGRVPLVIGTAQNGTDTTISFCREAQEYGAAGVMIAPPTFVNPGAGLTNHFRRIGEAIDIPIILQDFPPVNGVTMTPRDMADLANTNPSITTIKLEDTPTAQRIGQTLALLDEGITILGAWGGVYMLDELRRGASGTMTGFSHPEVLVDIWQAWESGDRQQASEIYYRWLPLIHFEGQPKIGLAIRKEVIHRRGLIASPTLRQPGPSIGDDLQADLTETLEFVPFEGYSN